MKSALYHGLGIMHERNEWERNDAQKNFRNRLPVRKRYFCGGDSNAVSEDALSVSASVAVSTVTG